MFNMRCIYLQKRCFNHKHTQHVAKAQKHMSLTYVPTMHLTPAYLNG